MFVCCECCVLSGKGLCEGLITHPEESYRLWCVVCDLETSWMKRPWPTEGRCTKVWSGRHKDTLCLTFSSHGSVAENASLFGCHTVSLGK